MNLRQGLLEARDGRQGKLQRAMEESPSGPATSILMISSNIPGGDKHRPGLSRMLAGACHSLRQTLDLEMLFAGRDLLGPFHLASTRLPPLDAKRASLILETAGPAGRLLDIDVYGRDGAQVDRATLGLPPRACLVCLEPAGECIRLQRHGEPELLARVDSLLQPFLPFAPRLLPEPFARQLAEGAHAELELTPKPGLVDRADSGSHQDLSFEGMRTSADLLPFYFSDILRCFREGRPLEDFVQAGREAEARMTRAIHSNAHKGYIFISGLALMAACESGGQVPLLRSAISATARRFFAHVESRPSHGAEIRTRLGLGGIRAEAEAGLPAIFEHGWPRYREALEAGWGLDHAGFYLMAILMQRVEDTTAIRRCGLEGLSRLRRDGERLQRFLEKGQAPESMLAALNEEYRRLGLTMGGVADCMALTFALEGAASALSPLPPRPSPVPRNAPPALRSS